jgi:hypothetical protein
MIRERCDRGWFFSPIPLLSLCRVDPVPLVYLAGLVYLVLLRDPEKPDRPDQREKPAAASASRVTVLGARRELS